MPSTTTPILDVTKDDGKEKPAIYKFYDFSKGGTDVVDQRIGFYSCKAKSRFWTMSALAYVLDTCRVNASTLYSMNQGTDPRKQDSFEFGMKLVMSLVRPYIEMSSRYGLSTEIQAKIKFVLGEPASLLHADSSDVSCFTLLSEARRRCEECKKQISGPGAKQAKDKLAKIRSQCQNCGKSICQRHSFCLCSSYH